MQYDASPKPLTIFLSLALGACSGGGGADDDAAGMTTGGGLTPTTGATTPATGGATTATGAPAPGATAGSVAPGGTVPTQAPMFDVCTNPELDDSGNIMVRANEANNYSFASTLTFTPTLVAPNSNLHFDWSAVTIDFLGHSLDTMEDIDMVAVMLWRLNQTELQAKLNDDSLSQVDLVSPAMFYPEQLRQEWPEEMGLSATLLHQDVDAMGEPMLDEEGQPIMDSDLSLYMNPLEPDEFMPYFDHTAYPPEAHIYTLIASTGTEPGAGTRMIHAFVLDPASENTSVAMTNDSTRLDYTTDLQTLTPTQIPAGTPGITLGWREMAVNALGNEFTPTSIAEVRISRYTQTPAELETQFLDLELIAAESYSAEVPAGVSVDLSTMTNEAGQPFPGIDGNGTWLLALMCGSCRNPAPWYISTLTPCGG